MPRNDWPLASSEANQWGGMRNFVLLVVVLSMALGCGSHEQSEDPRCLQTQEFGNTGCAVLRGLVTDGLGVPVAGAHVSVQGPADPARPIVLTSGSKETDSGGAYSLRAIRDAGEAPAEGLDTITVWVRAVVDLPGAPVGTRLPSDSVLATLEIRPVGETPIVTEVGTMVVTVP